MLKVGAFFCNVMLCAMLIMLVFELDEVFVVC